MESRAWCELVKQRVIVFAYNCKRAVILLSFCQYRSPLVAFNLIGISVWSAILPERIIFKSHGVIKIASLTWIESQNYQSPSFRARFERNIFIIQLSPQYSVWCKTSWLMGDPQRSVLPSTAIDFSRNSRERLTVFQWMLHALRHVCRALIFNVTNISMTVNVPHRYKIHSDCDMKHYFLCL